MKFFKNQQYLLENSCKTSKGLVFVYCPLTLRDNPTYIFFKYSYTATSSELGLILSYSSKFTNPLQIYSMSMFLKKDQAACKAALLIIILMKSTVNKYK